MNIKRLASIIGLPIVGLLILILIGTILFSFFEKIDLFNAFYWTITVLSTVGFGDITPKTFAGKILFIFIIVFGLALFGYFITQISSLWSEERVMKVIQGIYGFIKTDGGGFRDHVILLGWNNFIKSAYDELIANEIPAYIVVNNDDLARQLNREGVNVLLGSLVDDKFLKEIRLSYAKAVVIAYDNMTDTIVDILRVRKYSRKVKIVVLNYKEELEDVMRQAGADIIINIADIGGRILANSVFEHQAAEVVIDLLSKGGLDIIEYEAKSNIDGKTIGEIKDKVRGDIISLYHIGKYISMPDDDVRISKGDKIVILGITEDLDRTKEDLDKN